jgi:hypothetical protein
VRSALRYLADLLGHDGGDDRYLVEIGAILTLVAAVAVISLVFLGDPIADLITLVGGRVDEATLGR